MIKLTQLFLAFLLAVLPILPGFAQAMDRDPVSQTPLSQLGVSLQSGIVAPTRGLATSLADIERGSNYAKVLNNLQMLKRGVWTSRGIGWAKERETVFNAGAAFLDFGNFTDGSANQSLLFQVGNTLYSYNLGTSTETSIGSMTSLSTTALPCMRNSVSVTGAAPITIYCNGDIEPRKITSTSASSALAFTNNTGAGAWPRNWPLDASSKQYSKPAFCEPFGDRMAFAGFVGNATTYDILISVQGDPETFTTSTPSVVTDAVAFTVPAILGPIRGLRSFKLANENNDEVLLIGCTNGIAMITGSNAGEYALKILTRSHGLASNRCWVQVDNNLYYLGSDGIRSYSSLISNANLLSSTLTYLIQDQINLIDTAHVKKAHATHHPKTQEIQWWVPYTGDSGVPQHALVMSYNNEFSNSEGLVPVWSSKSGFGATCSAVFGGQFYHGTSDGFLCEDYSGDTYGGTPIVFEYVTPLIGIGNPGQMASSRKVTVVCDGQKQKFNIKPYVYSRLVSGETRRATGVPAIKELEGGASGSTSLGGWILASSPFPSDHIRTLDFQAQGQGIFWEYQIQAGASDHVIDLAALQYILSGGGLQR